MKKVLIIMLLAVSISAISCNEEEVSPNKMILQDQESGENGNSGGGTNDPKPKPV